MSLSYTRSAFARRAQLFRQQISIQARRQASTTEIAKEKAGEVASKASEGLSKVQQTAGSAASQAGSAANKATGRLGSLVNSIQSLVPPTVYYSKVAWEMSKIVFETRKMSLPSGAQFQSYYNTALSLLRNPSAALSSARGATNPATYSQLLSSVRNMNQSEALAIGIVTAEVLGFFTVGEIIGRLKLIGYRSSAAHHGEH